MSSSTPTPTRAPTRSSCRALAWALPAVAASCLASHAAAARAPAGPRRLRGFSVNRLSRDVLADLAADWNANAVRHMITPGWRAKRDRCTPSEAWRRYVAELPAGLDLARELGFAVVLDLHQLPNDGAGGYWETREGLRGFWADPANKRLLVDCWRELARACRGREQEIWFDILNEPLDWDDFPSYPRRWPEWAQAAVDAIGEIDARRPVVIEPGPGGLSWGFRDFPAIRGGNVIYSLHNYQPHEYTHQGVAEVQNTDLRRAYLKTGLPWPTEVNRTLWDAARLEKEFASVVEFQRKHRCRIYVGEFGAIRWAPGAAKYLEDNIAIFERHGWDWTCHSFREWHGWSPEHDETFGNDEAGSRAKAETARARVLKDALALNAAPAGRGRRR